MFGIGGALVSILGAVVVGIVFGPLSLLAAVPLVLFGVLIGVGMSESRRELEYRGERRWRSAEDRTTEALTEPSADPLRFGEWTIDPDRSTP